MKDSVKNLIIIVLVVLAIVSAIIFIIARNNNTQKNIEENNATEKAEVINNEEENKNEVISTNIEENNEDETTTSKNNVLVVYFSHTGTTKDVAKYLNNIVKGDLIELEPVEAYPSGYSAALDPAKQEQRENARPKLKTKIDNFDEYDTIYLGYPIWWGTVPMVINTFLESYDFSNKTVIPFATSGGTGISQSITDIKNEVPNANVKEGLLVRNNSEIDSWLKRIGEN